MSLIEGVAERRSAQSILRVWQVHRLDLAPDFLQIAVSCPRFFWTAICLTGGSDGEIEHEQNRTQVCG